MCIPWTCVQVSQLVYRGQRTFRSWFSPTTVCVQGWSSGHRIQWEVPLKTHWAILQGHVARFLGMIMSDCIIWSNCFWSDWLVKIIRINIYVTVFACYSVYVGKIYVCVYLNYILKNKNLALSYWYETFTDTFHCIHLINRDMILSHEKECKQWQLHGYLGSWCFSVEGFRLGGRNLILMRDE